MKDKKANFNKVTKFLIVPLVIILWVILFKFCLLIPVSFRVGETEYCFRMATYFVGTSEFEGQF